MEMKTVDIFDWIEENNVRLNTKAIVNSDRIHRLTLEKIEVQKPAASAGRRGLRLLILAAVITAMLVGTTMIAYAGYAKYGDSLELLNVFFGDTSFAGGEGGETVIVYPGDKEVSVTHPTAERVPLDETVAQEAVAPYIMAVDQSVSLDGSTLTVIAHQYDSVVGSGIIYYTLENTGGVTDYELGQDKEIWWSEGTPIRCDIWGTAYMIEEETTRTKLSVAYYYQLPLSFEESSISIGLDESNMIRLELNRFGNVESRMSADGNIVLTPTGMRMCLDDMEFLGVIDTNGMHIPPRDSNRILYLSLAFEDGSEFVVVQDQNGKAVANYVRASVISCFPTYVSYTFNRIIDVGSVVSVTVNDVSYPVGDVKAQGTPEKTGGTVSIGGTLTFVEASVSEEKEAEWKCGAIDEGKLTHRILGARVVTNAKDIPQEGGFFDYSDVSVYTMKGDQLIYRNTEFIMEDGSFAGGVRLLLVDVEITSEDAENWTLNTWPQGIYEDSYIFRIDGVYWLREKKASNGERCREWIPDFFSGMNEVQEHPFAYRILPGEIRQFTVGFLIGGYMDGTVIPVEALNIRVPYGYDASEAEQHGKEQLFPIG